LASADAAGRLFACFGRTTLEVVGAALGFVNLKRDQIRFQSATALFSLGDREGLAFATGSRRRVRGSPRPGQADYVVARDGWVLVSSHILTGLLHHVADRHLGAGWRRRSPGFALMSTGMIVECL
jgi:hypothetical protein